MGGAAQEGAAQDGGGAGHRVGIYRLEVNPRGHYCLWTVGEELAACFYCFLLTKKASFLRFTPLGGNIIGHFRGFYPQLQGVCHFIKHIIHCILLQDIPDDTCWHLSAFLNFVKKKKKSQPGGHCYHVVVVQIVPSRIFHSIFCKGTEL